MATIADILPQLPFTGPPLPRGAGVTWSDVKDEVSTYKSDIAVGTNGKPIILPSILYLLSNSIGRAALNATMSPGILQPWIDEINRYVEANGKFSKFAVMYTLVSPPPVFWDYKCKKCRAWVEPDVCNWVEGKISPQGWCSIWLPPDSYKQLTYPSEFLKGNW